MRKCLVRDAAVKAKRHLGEFSAEVPKCSSADTRPAGSPAEQPPNQNAYWHGCSLNSSLQPTARVAPFGGVAFRRRQESCTSQAGQKAGNVLPHTCFEGGLGGVWFSPRCGLRSFCSVGQQRRLTQVTGSGRRVLAQRYFTETLSSAWKLGVSEPACAPCRWKTAVGRGSKGWVKAVILLSIHPPRPGAAECTISGSFSVMIETFFFPPLFFLCKAVAGHYFGVENAFSQYTAASGCKYLSRCSRCFQETLGCWKGPSVQVPFPCCSAGRVHTCASVTNCTWHSSARFTHTLWSGWLLRNCSSVWRTAPPGF